VIEGTLEPVKTTSVRSHTNKVFELVVAELQRLDPIGKVVQLLDLHD